MGPGVGLERMIPSNPQHWSLKSSRTENEALVTDLNILAAPNDHGAGATNDDAITGNFIEQVALDGSNIGNFGIGDVRVETTLAEPFTNTSIFGGESSFMALGAIGDVTITGGSAGAQQSRLFANNTADGDGVWFSVGDGDGLLFDGDDILTNAGHFGPDSTASGDSGAVIGNASPDYTDGEVTVGNISLTAKQTDFAGNKSEVDALSGDEATEADIRGFGVLAGVFSISGGDLATSTGSDLDLVTTNVTAVDDELEGNVGTVRVTSNNAFGFLQHEVTGTDIDTTVAAGFYSAVIAATEVGELQGSTQDVTSGEGAVIGDLDGAADGPPAVVENANQLIVLVV